MNKKPSALITFYFLALLHRRGFHQKSSKVLISPHKSLNTSVAIIIFLHSLDFSRDIIYILLNLLGFKHLFLYEKQTENH